MNYYNPYLYSFPTNTVSKVGLFSRLFGNSSITFGGILNGTQKVLNIANQAIPLVKEAKPMLGNAKTIFKVMNEFKKVKTPIKNKTNKIVEEKNTKNINNPNFFA